MERIHPARWGFTFVELLEISIYLDPNLDDSWAETDIRRDGRPFITMHPDVLKHPEILDEILMHEFVHVLEYMFAAELRKKNPPNCTQHAIILGRHLPRMLKYLQREGLNQDEAVAARRGSKPRKGKRRAG